MSKLNLKPIEEMLDSEISSEEVAEELSSIAYTYSRCVLQNVEEIDLPTVHDNLWFLRMLRNRFLKIENPDEEYVE